MGGGAGVVIIKVIVHGFETWTSSVWERSKLEGVEGICVRNKCGIRKRERVRNNIMRGNCGAL